MKYYEVEAKCGHVRRSNYIIKKFYVCANDGKEAALKVRKSPRVKHHHKDAIRSVNEIDYEIYLFGLNKTSNDPYFLVHNSSEQRDMCEFDDNEIIREEEKITFKKPTHAKRRIINDMFIKDWKSGRSYLYE